MTDTTLLSLIGMAGAMGLYIIIAAVKWGRLREKVENLGDDEEALKRGLYMSNGTLVYVTEEHCNMLRENCSKLTCRKMDEVKAQVAALGMKLDKTNEKQAAQFAEIAKFMGAVQAFVTKQMPSEAPHG